MNDDPTSDLAEMTLAADMLKLQAGLYSSAQEHAELVRSALESAAILARIGGYSQGDAALDALIDTLRKLEAE